MIVSRKPQGYESGGGKLIIVESDETMAAIRDEASAAARAASRGVGFGVGAGAGAAALGLVAPAGLIVGGLALSASVAKGFYDSWSGGKLGDLNIQQVSLTEATALDMPAGRPVIGSVYAPHPCVDSLFYPIASFHRWVFNDKIADASRLLRSLGATSIKIESVQGWDKSISANLAGLVNGADVGAQAGSMSTSSAIVIFECTFENECEPSVPKDLRWYAQEPLWQEVGEGRLQHGMRTFSLEVTYNEDHNINAGLKAKLKKAGLDIGGAFRDHVATTWKMTGTFNNKKPT